MANTSGRMKCVIALTPEEQVESTTVSSLWSDIYVEDNTLASAIKSSTYTESLTFDDDGKGSFGYLNGDPYLAKITTTSTNTLSTGITQVEFVYFEHTGYRFNVFTDATCDTNHTAGSGTSFGGNPKIIQMDATTNVIVGMTVSGTGVASDSVVTQIDSDTLFRVDLDTTATNANQTLTFTGHNERSLVTTNSTDYLEIRGDADDGFVIAVLAPHEGIALPVRSSSGWSTSADRNGTTNYYFQSVDPDDLTAGANTIAMKYFAATHS